MTIVMIGVMACAVSSRPTYFSSSSTKRILFCTLSSSSTRVCSKTPNLSFSTSSSVKGLACFSQWSGLRHLGISARQKYAKAVKLFIWVARNLGKTLRAFQPTIRELQFDATCLWNVWEVSAVPSWFWYYPKIYGNPVYSMSLDMIHTSQVADDVSSPNKAYSTKDNLKITEEQLKAATQQQQQTPLGATSATATEPTPLKITEQLLSSIQEATAAGMPPMQKPGSES
ncbi:Sec-independent protein translocase protein TatA/B/E [Dillenia turbinata]|uniref:Sec-independent protein translocase protein TatA/B/E n=1 Tax=Dillenia turbinata TaxID=194707 RepID=A0AAN8VME8_9MAGN